MDFVPNHSSSTHEWFQKSVDRIEPYDKFYIWADAKGRDANGEPIPPNNWVRNFSTVDIDLNLFLGKLFYAKANFIYTGESFRWFSLALEQEAAAILSSPISTLYARF